MAKDFIPWRGSFNTNIVEIDDQHKKLVALINELYKAYIEKQQKKIIEKVIDELINYTVYHFEIEENYFKQFEYENTEEHIKEHQEFVKSVESFKHKFGKNERVLTTEMLLFLQKWITGHILGSDMKYIECFKNNGLIL